MTRVVIIVGAFFPLSSARTILSLARRLVHMAGDDGWTRPSLLLEGQSRVPVCRCRRSHLGNPAHRHGTASSVPGWWCRLWKRRFNFFVSLSLSLSLSLSVCVCVLSPWFPAALPNQQAPFHSCSIYLFTCLLVFLSVHWPVLIVDGKSISAHQPRSLHQHDGSAQPGSTRAVRWATD
ncbi:hypothetical protein IWZ03DRAFT_185603 [Phyllosticta citriasiana]|uniref:Uncharacterized protein n=1 Tax=Phyllosticta citriasiana TaxID=595635 RepID=A0ABR1KNB8_9PEZI